MNLNSLIFGNYKNAKVLTPKTGKQSIARISTYHSSDYSLDNSPTIGDINDSLGMCGTLKGKILDKNQNPITRKFNISLYFPLTIDVDGNYYSRVYSDSVTVISLSFDKYSGSHIVSTEPFSYTMAPDSTVFKDFQIKFDNKYLDKVYEDDSLFWIKYVGIEKQNKRDSGEDEVLRVFPNPYNIGSAINYEIYLPVKSTGCNIKMTNEEGKLIRNYTLNENTGKLDIPNNLKNGFYIFQLVINNKTIVSKQVIINKQ